MPEVCSLSLHHCPLLIRRTVKVSPLALGTMSLGSKQEAIFGTGATKDEALKYLDIYREAGGNFIDLA